MDRIEWTDFRTYLVVDNKRVKVLPVKYQQLPVDNILKCVDLTIKKKTLTKDERRLLDLEVLFVNFKSYLKNNEPLVFEMIGDSTPVRVRNVELKFEDSYYELLLSNGVYVKCSVKFTKYLKVETIHRNY